MATKLTLRVDEEMVKAAKVYSRERGKSVSQIVGDYFAVLGRRPLPPPSVRVPEGSITASLWGALKVPGSEDLGEEDYRRYLEDKHL